MPSVREIIDRAAACLLVDVPVLVATRTEAPNRYLTSLSLIGVIIGILMMSETSPNNTGG